MGKSRLEAFSDGVVAIIITIMVLEMKVPHGEAWSDLFGLWPVFLSYILSFVYVGIYWNNHHHLLHATERISGATLWANLHLLFWLSLIPFSTGWMGENHFAEHPVALYALNLLMCAMAFVLLQVQILKIQGEGSRLARAIGSDYKGKVSVAAYLVAIALALLGLPAVAGFLLFIVACIWFIPDRRIESTLSQH